VGPASGGNVSEVQAPPDGELWDLENLAGARRLCDWMFEQYGWAARGACVEVGAGIGTFSARLLDAGVESLLLLEPENACANVLEKRFAEDPRTRIRREQLPEPRSLLDNPRAFDFVLCQNVLEHVLEHVRAVEVMASALRPGGRLTILVPANPALFGPLDSKFGHLRRYTQEALSNLVEGAGLSVTDLYSFNALGIAGWWVKNRTGATSLGQRSLAAYEALLPLWRPVERRLHPRWGLSLIAHAERR
jgi:SAM-dependent methyltransferase